MKKIYIVEVDIDEVELADLNAKRKRQGQQEHSADDRVAFEVGSALTSKLFSNAKCNPMVEGTFTLGGDPDASL